MLLTIGVIFGKLNALPMRFVNNCSEPRLAFNRTVVLRYRIYLEQKQYAPNRINLRLAARPTGRV